jgi:hypothetical protein
VTAGEGIDLQRMVHGRTVDVPETMLEYPELLARAIQMGTDVLKAEYEDWYGEPPFAVKVMFIIEAMSPPEDEETSV